MNRPFKLLTYFLFLTILFSSCTDTVILSYDESRQGAILEKNLNISPADNLNEYLLGAGASYSNVKILNENGETCACSFLNGKCTCQLNNAKGANPDCEHKNTKCTKRKLIKIAVSSGDVAGFNSIGFKQTDKPNK